MQTVMQPKKVHVIPAKSEFTSTSAIAKSLRVAAYCRVSTDKDEQEKSYEAQKSYYTDMIMQNPEWQFAGIYADEGITGTQAAKRPDFMRMIRDCKNGKIDLIVTKSVQRFARNTLDSIESSRTLKNLGIGIVFETQGLDTRKMSNEFMLTLFASMAQNESENISANVKWGRQKAFKNGSVHFAYKSFLGYRKGADGKPEIIPEEAETIRRIYNDFISGTSLRDIALNLMAEGILTARGREKWTAEVIKSILKNEKYVGDALLQKTYIPDCLTHKSKINNGELPQYYVENNHPAIVEREIWNRAQEELARRSSKRKVKEVGTTTEQGKYSGRYALTELLVCGECGTPYRRCTWNKRNASSGERTKRIVWRCISRLDYGKKYCKTSPTLDEHILQKAILAEIMALVQTNTTALEVFRQHVGIGLADDNENDMYFIKSQLGEISTALSELYETQAKNPSNDYESQFETLYAKRDTLREKFETLSLGHTTSPKQKLLDEIFEFIECKKSLPLEWDEQVIRQIVECVKVISKNKLGIRFRVGVEIEVEIGK